MSAPEPELPAGWEWCALEDVAEVRLGRQRSPKNHFGPNMVPYLRAGNVTWDGLDLTDVNEMQFTPEEVQRYALQRGDILLAEASGSASEVGKPAIWRGEMETVCFQNTLIRVRSDGPLPEYLMLVLREAALSGRFGKAALGVGINHLGQERLARWRIPLAPLEVQGVMVAEVERLLSVTSDGNDAVATGRKLVRALRRAVLAAAFTGRLVRTQKNSPAFDVGTLEDQRRARWAHEQGSRPYKQPAQPVELPDAFPSHWPVVSLEQATDPNRVICYGILKPKVKGQGTVPYVEVKDLRARQLSVGGLHKTTKKLHDEFKRSMLAEGDVVLAIRGSYDCAAIVPSSLAGANISRDVARLAPLSGVSTEFLYHYLTSPVAQRYLDARARGVAVKGVNIGHLREDAVAAPVGR